MMLFDGPLFVKALELDCSSQVLEYSLLVNRVKTEILEFQNDPTS